MRHPHRPRAVEKAQPVPPARLHRLPPLRLEHCRAHRAVAHRSKRSACLGLNTIPATLTTYFYICSQIEFLRLMSTMANRDQTWLIRYIALSVATLCWHCRASYKTTPARSFCPRRWSTGLQPPGTGCCPSPTFACNSMSSDTWAGSSQVETKRVARYTRYSPTRCLRCVSSRMASTGCCRFRYHRSLLRRPPTPNTGT
ncbi:hypothetical protein BC831DRAFT_199698 [Entophlyctis helioformis]|nr:hypothetical protein BC831DRAFT_199698 [Entophlyctis helioformis]